jgi:hypothetical protein
VYGFVNCLLRDKRPTPRLVGAESSLGLLFCTEALQRTASNPYSHYDLACVKTEMIFKVGQVHPAIGGEDQGPMQPLCGSVQPYKARSMQPSRAPTADGDLGRL